MGKEWENFHKIHTNNKQKIEKFTKKKINKKMLVFVAIDK